MPRASAGRTSSAPSRSTFNKPHLPSRCRSQKEIFGRFDSVRLALVLFALENLKIEKNLAEHTLNT